MILVAIRGTLKSHIIHSREVSLNQSNDDLCREIVITAGAIAEYQCEVLNDPADPDEVIKEVTEAFRKLIAELKQCA